MDSDDKKKVNHSIKCGNCDATENLMKCKCNTAAYCSRECQEADWGSHKIMCRFVSRFQNATSLEDLMRVMMKASLSERNPIPVTFTTFTHAGLVSSSDTTMPRGVPQNFLYIKQASTKFVSLKNGEREYGEALYQKLFDELVKNKDEWGQFFRYPANKTHAGDACMCLGSLVSIFKERHNFEYCEKIIEVMEFLLNFVKMHSGAGDDLSNFVVTQEYNILNDRYDISLTLKKFKRNVRLIREGVEFEEKHSIPQRKYSFKDLWRGMAECWNAIPLNPKVNVKRIDTTTDDMLLQMFHFAHTVEKEMRGNAIYEAFEADAKQKHANDLGITVEEYENRMSKKKLQHCGYCHVQESSLGQFKQCNQCKVVFYCGRDCQVKHWRSGHKKECTKQMK